MKLVPRRKNHANGALKEKLLEKYLTIIADNRNEYKGNELYKRNYSADRLFHLCHLHKSNNLTEESLKTESSVLYSEDNVTFISNMLLYEYGHIPKHYPQAKCSIETVSLHKIQVYNSDYFDRLIKNSINKYSIQQEDIPKLVLRENPNGYMIIDGHHRFSYMLNDDFTETLAFIMKH